MEFYSHYLEANIDIDVYQVGDVDGFVASHRELKRIFNSTDGLSVTANTLVLDTEKSVYAFEAVISDKSGRSVSEVGETNKLTLLSAISQQYPITMAYGRAFDRALIRFLQLDERILSSFEIMVGRAEKGEKEVIPSVVSKEAELTVEETPVVVVPATPVEPPVKAEVKSGKSAKPAKADAKKKAPPAAADDDFDIEIEDDADAVIDTAIDKKKAKKKLPVAVIDEDGEIDLDDFDDDETDDADEVEEAEAPQYENLGGTKIPIGKFKGKTFEEAAAIDKSAIRWLVNTRFKALDDAVATELQERAAAYWEIISK